MMYEETDTLHAVYEKHNCSNKFIIDPKLFKDTINHFPRQLDEISLLMTEKHVLVRSWASGALLGGDDIRSGRLLRNHEGGGIIAGDANKNMQTELVMESEEFDVFVLSSNNKVNTQLTNNTSIPIIELTFGLREFKSILQYAEAANIPLQAHFDSGGDPILFSISDDISGLPNTRTRVRNDNYGNSNSTNGTLSNGKEINIEGVSAEFVLATVSDINLSSQNQTQSSLQSIQRITKLYSQSQSPEQVKGLEKNINIEVYTNGVIKKSFDDRNSIFENGNHNNNFPEKQSDTNDNMFHGFIQPHLKKLKHDTQMRSLESGLNINHANDLEIDSSIPVNSNSDNNAVPPNYQIDVFDGSKSVSDNIRYENTNPKTGFNNQKISGEIKVLGPSVGKNKDSGDIIFEKNKTKSNSNRESHIRILPEVENNAYNSASQSDHLKENGLHADDSMLQTPQSASNIYENSQSNENMDVDTTDHKIRTEHQMNAFESTSLGRSVLIPKSGFVHKSHKAVSIESSTNRADTVGSKSMADVISVSSKYGSRVDSIVSNRMENELAMDLDNPGSKQIGNDKDKNMPGGGKFIEGTMNKGKVITLSISDLSDSDSDDDKDGELAATPPSSKQVKILFLLVNMRFETFMLY
ncbi:hypothetical protein BB558_006424 [Smittium angustum]|uniref:Uncharacterized protein n=1 Tax=Smittium angustum TaxID=133377 RepID=A0A2U1IXS9_SMIAN|nr:hypothetical protein BB558_006424 [Smittium angustum]